MSLREGDNRLSATDGQSGHRLGLVALWGFVCLVALFVGFLFAPASSAHDPAYETRSYYITTSDYDTINDLGCQTAQQSRQGRMVLFYGSPVEVSGTYGATLWGDYQTVSGVASLARGFARGYHNCASGDIFMRLGVGISNCLIGGASDDNCKTSASYKTSSWVRGHGEAWALMVNDLQNWAETYGYSDRVYFYGAWDMEPSWSSYSRANAWMHGYDYDAPNDRPLYANDSADGCPQDSPLNDTTNGDCNNGWDQWWMWHESWDHSPAMPFVQVYYRSMAEQWMHIDEYGYHAESAGLYHFGVLAHDDINTPHNAHYMLMDELNSHSHTSQSSLRYTSLVTWTLQDDG